MFFPFLRFFISFLSKFSVFLCWKIIEVEGSSYEQEFKLAMKKPLDPALVVNKSLLVHFINFNKLIIIKIIIILFCGLMDKNEKPFYEFTHDEIIYTSVGKMLRAKG